MAALTWQAWLQGLPAMDQNTGIENSAKKFSAFWRDLFEP